MTHADIKYRRLPGRARPKFGLVNATQYQLWLGPDHVLHLMLNNYRETCRRFYFQDIQALAITRTRAGMYAGIFLGMAAAACLSLTAAGIFFRGWDRYVTLICFGGMAALFLMILLVHVVLGPTCRVRLHTAVRVEDLFSLGRLRTAEKTAAMLKPYIEAAQGRLGPEELGAFSPLEERIEASPRAV